jgi:hypothetical protein
MVVLDWSSLICIETSQLGAMQIIRDTFLTPPPPV